MEGDAGKKILLTGASGYVGSWIAKVLVDDGHFVRATVRDKSKREKVGHLEALSADAPGTLELFDADLLQPGSFDAAAEGCDVAIHSASPFFVSGFKDAQSQLVDPALEGTRNVLEAVNATESVTRVVLTSSIVATMSDPIELRGERAGVLDERAWNETASLTHHPYAYSKTLAEREAWKMADAQERWDLVTINPGFVFGPSLTKRTDSTSIDYMLKMISGQLKSGAADIHVAAVDVREVARAHLLAATVPEASGRHLLVAETLTYVEIARRLAERTGDRYKLPRRALPKALLYVVGPFFGFSWKMLRNSMGIPFEVDNTRSREKLGVTYRPLADTLADHAEQLERDGLAKS